MIREYESYRHATLGRHIRTLRKAIQKICTITQLGYTNRKARANTTQ